MGSHGRANVGAREETPEPAANLAQNYKSRAGACPLKAWSLSAAFLIVCRAVLSC